MKETREEDEEIETRERKKKNQFTSETPQCVTDTASLNIPHAEILHIAYEGSSILLLTSRPQRR